jgi:hypothetical protein
LIGRSEAAAAFTSRDMVFILTDTPEPVDHQLMPGST